MRAKAHDFQMVRNVLYWVAEPEIRNGRTVALSRLRSRWKLQTRGDDRLADSDAALIDWVRRHSSKLKPVCSRTASPVLVRSATKSPA